jgi:AraC-like DNA-binding protein
MFLEIIGEVFMEQSIFQYYQQQLSLNLQVDFCGFSKTLPLHTYGPAIRQNYILHFILRGRGSFSLGTTRYSLSKGDLFLIEPGVSSVYQADAEDPWLYGWIAFSGDCVKDILLQSSVLNTQPTYTTNHISHYVNLTKQLLALSEDNLTNELTRNECLLKLFQLIINETGQSKKPHPKKLSPLSLECLSYLRKFFDDPEAATIEGLAKHLNVNRSHLSRTFSTDMGITLKQQQLSLRINKASQLLMNDYLTIEQIAEECGFNSLVVFSRDFKTITGESPFIYRKRMKHCANFQDDDLKDVIDLLVKQEIVTHST